MRFIVGDIDYDENHDECHPREFRESFQASDSVYRVPREISGLVDIAGQHWPECIRLDTCAAPRSAKEAFFRAVAHAWECAVNDLEEWSEDEYEVGEVDGTPIIRDVNLLRREDLKKS